MPAHDLPAGDPNEHDALRRDLRVADREVVRARSLLVEERERCQRSLDAKAREIDSLEHEIARLREQSTTLTTQHDLLQAQLRSRPVRAALRVSRATRAFRRWLAQAAGRLRRSS